MLDGEEKISGPRRGRDLQIVERSFRWCGRHWYVVQTNTDHWVHASNYPGFKTSRRATAVISSRWTFERLHTSCC